MDDETIAQKLKELRFSAGHRAMSIEDVVKIQPGLGRLMPEVGARTWKLFYAAKAGNWPMAKFQWKEIKGLFEFCAFTRPKHEEALNRYMEKNWQTLEGPLGAENFAAFEAAFHKCVQAANVYHEMTGKPYIVWQLPDTPPPDLDLRPREVAKK